MSRTVACVLILVCLHQPVALSAAATEYSIDAGQLGLVSVYTPDGEPGSVVLFLSGDGGWNSGVVSMALNLRSWGALVAGIDVTKCLHPSTPAARACADPVVDVERLAHELEKSAGLTSYKSPILVGYSSGANVAYSLAARAPTGTFSAAISLGFCANEGSGLRDHLPDVVNLHLPWVALHGALDQVCSAEATRAFAARIPSAKFVLLPNVGHGYAVEANWLPQFRDAYLKLVAGWVPGSVPKALAVQPALKPLTGTRILCRYSAEDAASICPTMTYSTVRAVVLPGGHHFNGDSATLVREIAGFTEL